MTILFDVADEIATITINWPMSEHDSNQLRADIHLP
jgi:hypothetical protein